MDIFNYFLNCFISLFFGLITMIAVNEFSLNKANARDITIMNIVIQFIWLIIAIPVFGYANIHTYYNLGPYWGLVPFQFLHYFVWAVVAYNLKPTNKKK